MLAAIKYLLAAALFAFAGTLFCGDAINFTARSDPAQLRVLSVDSRPVHGRRNREYRPVFALAEADPQVQPYAGEIWSSPALHHAGEIVAGRIDRATGEMRSTKMLRFASWIGAIALFLAALIGAEALALLAGTPESALPLRLTRT